MRRLTVIIPLLAALGALADEAPRATGFRPHPFAPAVRRVETAKAPVRLRSGGDSLPARWDSREHGWISPVKNQGELGTCWTFATFAVLETQLIKVGKGVYDFSEKNMANLHGFEWTPEEGGNFDMSAAYLLRWGGAVAESNDVYVTTLADWTQSPMLVSEMRVQNVVQFPMLGASNTSTQELKSAIMSYGAVGVAMRWGGSYYHSASNAYYCYGTPIEGHAVTVVGWNDDFPHTAFKVDPGVDGAWLVKNSWGSGWGDNGYFWVSYNDKWFGQLMYPTVFIPAAEDEDYDVVRGYDRCGSVYDVTATYDRIPRCCYDLQASVFTSTWNEELAAVGLYSYVYPDPYEILIYTNVVKGATSPVEGGTLACVKSGFIEHPGFTTIHLDSPIPLADTNSFAVVYRQTGYYRQTIVSCTMHYSDGYYSHPTNYPGNCYVGYVTNAGTNVWLDACDEADYVDPTDEGWGLCIKAYTRFTKGAPMGDAPPSSEDGARMMSDLAAAGWPWLQETSTTFGSAVGFVGANGRSLWANWLLGLDPASPESRDIVLSIDMSGGTPSISWAPSLPGRTYILYGRDSLTPGDAWREVDPAAPGATGAHYFRLAIGQ